MNSSNAIEEQVEFLRRGCAELISEQELRGKLQRKKTLRVKAGFDPTSADLHLGHTVVMHKLRHFQECGHKVLFLIGDFTARIGDPSGRSETRPTLSPEEIARNAETYQDQAFKILDRNRTEVVWNSHWMDDMPASQLMRLAAEYTVARMLERDDFQNRYKSGRAIGVHEFLYPLVQGYDSVALEADVEIGGTDQKFNLLVGRDLQRNRQKEPQVVMTMPLLEGLDGVQKMSKSLGNAVGISEPPSEMFGKIMSISDVLMARYYELLSSVGPDRVVAVREGQVHPMEAKKSLALELTARYHGDVAAEAAREAFERHFQRRELPAQIPELDWPASDASIAVCELLKGAGLVASLSEARRLIAQGGVKVEGERVADVQARVDARGSVVLQVGKRKLLKVRFAA